MAKRKSGGHKCPSGKHHVKGFSYSRGGKRVRVRGHCSR